MSQRGWTASGAILWIIGLTLFIIGLNLTGSTREWMTIAGSLSFLIGLGITGAVWMKKKQKDE
jgi:hypothetical protein